MRRWAPRILVFLLLGAIVNVAVAWGCSQWAGRRIGPSSEPSDDSVLRAWWHRNCPLPLTGEPEFFARDTDSFPGPSVRIRTFEASRGLRVWNMGAPVRDGADARHVFATAVYSGWPFTALAGEKWVDETSVWEGGDPADLEPAYRWAVPGRAIDATNADGDEGGFLMGERMLPLYPLWPGFAINTVFYAVILWLLFAAPFALRRRWRIKRGLCPKCAYELRGSTGGACPECGATK